MNANAQYHSRNRMSNSRLSVLKRSPREYKQRFIDRTWLDKPSDDFLIGELVHCICLEPAEYPKRYAVLPDVDGRTKEGKLAKSLFAEMSVGKKPIEAKQEALAKTLAERLGEHELFRQIEWNPYRHTVLIEHEIDFVFDGVDCKAKLDYVDTERRLIVDLKTTKDVVPGMFARSVGDYGYHRQAAFYKTAADRAFGEDYRFIFACVAKTPPYEVACYELDDDAITIGDQELLALLAEYRYRVENDHWEADWSSGIVSLGLPKFYRSNIYEVGELA